MGTSFTRPTLVGNVNDAFNARNIEDTVARVAHLAADADAFDFVHALGLFNLPSDAELAAYKADVKIPPLNKAILALAFQTAVAGKIPLSFAIIGGHAETVQVTTSDTLIAVVLTRID
ncbi:MAG: hypothetical protein NT133_10785 [Alphaproteobacteria bacterium]|nr:hypothetical protein [Alphaproteobacteria bacterium]